MWKLEPDPVNLNMITRQQKRKDSMVSNTLDYFLSNTKLCVSRLDSKGSSDHFPLQCKLQVDMRSFKRKFFTITKVVRSPSDGDIGKLLENEDWPIVGPNEEIKELTVKKLKLRPRLFLNVKGMDNILSKNF
jgi:hypothetical protein